MKNIYILFYFILITSICFAQNKPNEQKELILMEDFSLNSMFGGIKNNEFQKGVEISSKKRDVYSLEDSNLVFYRNKTSRSIKLASGDYIFVQNKDNKYRYKYSNLDTLTDIKKEYKKNEKIGQAKFGIVNYETGFLTFEVEDIANNKYLNPISILKIEDQIKPVIQDIYFKTSDGNTVSFLKDKQLTRGGNMFIKCKDRIYPKIQYYTPYSINVIINGVPYKKITFDYLKKQNNQLTLSDTDYTFDTVYSNSNDFEYFLFEFNTLPGLVGFQVIVEDFAGNNQSYRKALKVLPPVF